MLPSQKLRVSIGKRCVVAALLVVAGLAGAQEPTDYEQVLEAIGKATGERNAWQADIELKMDMGTTVMAYKGQTKVQGELSQTRMAVKMLGQNITILTVADRNGIQWTEMIQDGNKQIMRVDTKKLIESLGEDAVSAANLGQGPGTPVNVNRSVLEILDEFSESFKIDYLGTAEFPDGMVYLIEGLRAEAGDELTGLAAQLDAAGLAIERLVIAVGVEDAFPRSIEWFGKEDRELMKLSYKSVEFNPEFEVGTFTYLQRPGVTIMDMTTMLEQRLRVK